MNNQMPMAQPQMPVQAKKNVELDLKMILMIAGIAASVLIILGIFLPMVTVKVYGLKESTSLWKTTHFASIVLIVLCLISAGTMVLGKLREISYLPAGFALYNVIYNFASWIDLDSDIRKYTHLSFGWFFLFLGTICLIAVNIYNSLDEIKKLFSGVSISINTNSTQPAAQPVQPVQPVQPAAPVEQPVVCSACGAKKVGDEKFCMTCGKQF